MCIRDSKDTAIPFLVNFTAYWCIGIPVAYLFGIYFNIGPIGMWFGPIIGLSIAALLHTWRFKILTSLDFKYLDS